MDEKGIREIVLERAAGYINATGCNETRLSMFVTGGRGDLFRNLRRGKANLATIEKLERTMKEFPDGPPAL